MPVNVTREILERLPKTELHVHLDGSLRLETLIELAGERRVKLPSRTASGLRKLVFKRAYRNLPEYLRGFEFTVACLQDAEALERAAYELCWDCRDENVFYVEIRFAPQLHVHGDFDLPDLGSLEFGEPVIRFRANGMIIREGAKMSKTKGNVIIPDEIIEQYGADTFRTYLMFLGPYEEGGDYQDEGIQGPHGFLHRLYETVTTAIKSETAPESNGDSGSPAAADPDVERKLHQTIRQVTRQIPELSYNTCIAAMMEYLNTVRAGGRTATRREVEPLVGMIAPFAPCRLVRRACSNRSRTRLAPTPTNISTKSEPLML